MPSSVGFVIRTRNEEQHVGFALQSVFNFFGDDAQVVVVDNSSSDETLQVVALFPKRFHPNLSIISIQRDHYTPGLSLNTGVSHITSPIVGVLSAHCEIMELQESQLLLHFKDANCVGVFGRQVPIYKGKKIKPRYVWSNFIAPHIVTNPVEDTGFDVRPFFHNAFSFIRTSFARFDQDLSGKEDRYWARDMISMGHTLKFDPALVCRHYWTSRGATWRDDEDLL